MILIDSKSLFDFFLMFMVGLAGVGEVDELPYTTLMFTTGGNYDYSCNNVTAHDEDTGEEYVQTIPLRHNLTGEDTTANNFQQLSAIWNGRGGETHGGEDVALYAYGKFRLWTRGGWRGFGAN
jgi:hypothetical protein